MAYILRLIFLFSFFFSFSAAPFPASTGLYNGIPCSAAYASEIKYWRDAGYSTGTRVIFDSYSQRNICYQWVNDESKIRFGIAEDSPVCPAGAQLSGFSCSCLSGLVESAGACVLPPEPAAFCGAGTALVNGICVVTPTTCTAGAPGPTFAVFTLPPFSYCNGKCTYVWSGSVGGPGVASETYTSATGSSCSTVSAPPSSADSGGTGTGTGTTGTGTGTGTTGTGTGTGTTGTTGTGSTVGDGCGTTTAGIACPNVGGGGSGTGTTGGTTGTGTTGGTTGTGTTGGTTGTGTTGGTTGTGTTGGTTGTGTTGGTTGTGTTGGTTGTGTTGGTTGTGTTGGTTGTGTTGGTTGTGTTGGTTGTGTTGGTTGTGTTGGTTGTGTTGGTTGTGTTGGTTGTGTTGGTTGTGTTGGTTGTGGSGGSAGGGDDPPPSDLCKDNPSAPSCSNDPCKANPDSLMCKKVNLGKLEPSVVVNSEELLTITKNQGWGPSSGSCPAPRVIYLASAGRSFEFSFKPLCDFANGIRPLVIALSWISAAFAFLRFSK